MKREDMPQTFVGRGPMVRRESSEAPSLKLLEIAATPRPDDTPALSRLRVAIQAARQPSLFDKGRKV